MTGGMAVAADDGGAGQRKALFRADDMDDALFRVGIANIADAEGRGIGLQRFQLLRAFGVGNRDAVARPVAPCRCRQIMVGHRQASDRAAALCVRHAQSFEMPAGW